VHATEQKKEKLSEILLLEFELPPLKLQQACKHISCHYGYTISHTHLVEVHLYRIRRQFRRRLSNCHPHQFIERRKEDAHTLLCLKGMYINPYRSYQVVQAKLQNRSKAFANFLKPFKSAVWQKD